MDIPDKKKMYRERALKHYYNNIEYYRMYYTLNKDRILIYSKEYRHKKLNDDLKYFKNTSKKRDLQIQYGQFIVEFD